MKKIIIIIDGMYDLDLKLYFTKSFLTYFNQSFVNYTHNNIADSFDCFLRILDIDNNIIEQLNRAYYECENDSYTSYGRYNLVLLKDGFLSDFTSGLSTNEIKKHITNLNIKEIINIDQYHGVIAFKDIINYQGYPPSNKPIISYQDLCNNLPTNVKEIITKSNNYFQTFNPNLALWPYNIKEKVKLKNISFDKTALIAHKKSLLNVAQHLNIKIFTDKKITGLSDTNLKLKTDLTKLALTKHDTCIIHIDGVDNLAHQGLYKEKLSFLHKIEKEVLQPLLSLSIENNYQLQILCDHICDTNTKIHHCNDVIKLERRI